MDILLRRWSWWLGGLNPWFGIWFHHQGQSISFLSLKQQFRFVWYLDYSGKSTANGVDNSWRVWHEFLLLYFSSFKLFGCQGHTNLHLLKCATPSYSSASAWFRGTYTAVDNNISSDQSASSLHFPMATSLHVITWTTIVESLVDTLRLLTKCL